MGQKRCRVAGYENGQYAEAADRTKMVGRMAPPLSVDSRCPRTAKLLKEGRPGVRRLSWARYRRIMTNCCSGLENDTITMVGVTRPNGESLKRPPKLRINPSRTALRRQNAEDSSGRQHQTRSTAAVPDCPYGCPCYRPEPAFQSQRRPTRSIDEMIEAVEFAWKDTNGREADRRLANRPLQPLGHLTAEELLSINDIAGYAQAIVRAIVPEIVPASDQNRLRLAAKSAPTSASKWAAVFF